MSKEKKRRKRIRVTELVFSTNNSKKAVIKHCKVLHYVDSLSYEIIVTKIKYKKG